MKHKSLLYLIAIAFFVMPGYTVQAQIKIGNILKQISSKQAPKQAPAKQAVTGRTSAAQTATTPAAGNPSTLEIGQGIKQALEVGISEGADKLSAKDGFLGNMAVKILFPPEAQTVEKTLRSIGLGALADNVITSLNRAAEDAAKEAKPIFVSAITQMTLTDATNILLGSENSATEYFKRATTSQLMEKFSPVITQSLSKVNATKYWNDAASSYNKIPLVKKPVETDLSKYVTQKAIDGMFIEVAQEELKIRDNIGARSSPLLQKVFGFADKSK